MKPRMTLPLMLPLTPETPSWFVPGIRKMMGTPIPPPSKSPIQFECSPVGMRHNSDLIESGNFNIGDLIAQCPNSEM